MSGHGDLSRRTILETSAALGASLTRVLGQTPAPPAKPPEFASLLQSIRDPDIRTGVDAAIAKNLLPAAVEEAYPLDPSA